MWSESIVKGQIIYDTNGDGLLLFKPNSSLTIKVDAGNKIINASLSCSIYQYADQNDNLIQVSTDGVQWVTIWEANTTVGYVDISDLKLPPSLNGQNSFYLRFFHMFSCFLVYGVVEEEVAHGTLGAVHVLLGYRKSFVL